MTKFPQPIIAFTQANLFVIIMVKHSQKYLLIEEAKKGEEHTWYFPGGRVLTGETLVEAATRETQEEAGVKIKPTGILHIDHQVDKEKIQPDWWRILMRAEYVGGELKQEPDRHSLQAGWFSLAEIKSLSLRGADREVIEKIEEYGNTDRLLPIKEYKTATKKPKKPAG